MRVALGRVEPGAQPGLVDNAAQLAQAAAHVAGHAAAADRSAQLEPRRRARAPDQLPKGEDLPRRQHDPVQRSAPSRMFASFPS
jgi:hypothetical protein